MPRQSARGGRSASFRKMNESSPFQKEICEGIVNSTRMCEGIVKEICEGIVNSIRPPNLIKKSRKDAEAEHERREERAISDDNCKFNQASQSNPIRPPTKFN